MGKKKGGQTVAAEGDIFRVGKKLSAKEIRKISEELDNPSKEALQDVFAQARKQGVKIKKTAQDFLTNYVTPEPSPAPPPPPNPNSAPASYSINTFSMPGVTAPPGTLTAPEYEAFLKSIPELGATERNKLVEETKLKMVETETKGKLDLQKIINSGYKNIADIERGSAMFGSIMGAFNF